MLFQKGEKDRKKKGYNLKDGKIMYKTGLVDEVTAKAGRASSKKAMKTSIGIRENPYSLFQNSVTAE